MRTKFLTALAAAVLMTFGTTAVALAQAADVQAEASNAAPAYANTSTNSGSAPYAVFSAHHHPYSGRHR